MSPFYLSITAFLTFMKPPVCALTGEIDFYQNKIVLRSTVLYSSVGSAGSNEEWPIGALYSTAHD